MKKLSGTIFCVVSSVLFFSCSLLSETFRPAYGSLPEGLYESKEINSVTGYLNLTVDGEYLEYTSIGLQGYEKTLNILPGNKVVYSEKEYKYYEKTGENEYKTLNPPELVYVRWNECDGSYKLGQKKMIMFDFNVEPDYDGIKRGPLLSGSTWYYKVDDNQIELSRKAVLGEGGNREVFDKVLEPR